MLTRTFAARCRGWAVAVSHTTHLNRITRDTTHTHHARARSLPTHPPVTSLRPQTLSPYAQRARGRMRVPYFELIPFSQCLSHKLPPPTPQPHITDTPLLSL